MGDDDMATEPLFDPKWDAECLAMPDAKCGRLDMSTWSGDGEHMQKFVYVDGEADRTLVQGPYCDHIAYAAQRFKPIMSELATANAANRMLRETTQALIDAARGVIDHPDEPHFVHILTEAVKAHDAT